MTSTRIVLAIDWVHRMMEVHVASGEPTISLGPGGRLAIGRVSDCDVRVVARSGRLELPGRRSVFVSADGHGAWEVSSVSANVAVDGALRDGSGAPLRHGDTVQIFASNGELVLVLRAEVDGETTTPREPSRDWLALWESSVLGRSHGSNRELVVDRSGEVTLFEHPITPSTRRSHPLDAPALARGQLTAFQRDALGRIVDEAHVREMGPFERAATDSATLVLLDPRGSRVVRLSRETTMGAAEGPTFLVDAPELVLLALLGIARALRVDLAAWAPPAIPSRRNEPAGDDAEADLVLVSTEWQRDGTGQRIMVYASGIGLSGPVELDPSTGAERFRATTHARLPDATMERARAVAATDALTGGPHGNGSAYDTWQLVDRYVDGRRVRVTMCFEPDAPLPERLDAVVRSLGVLHRELAGR